MLDISNLRCYCEGESRYIYYRRRLNFYQFVSIIVYDKCTESGNDFNLRDNATAVALCGASLDLETILHRRRVETALHSEVKCPATTNYQECRSVPVLMFSIDCYAAKYNLTYCGNLVSECVSIRTSPGNINLPRSSCSYFVT